MMIEEVINIFANLDWFRLGVSTIVVGIAIFVYLVFGRKKK